MVENGRIALVDVVGTVLLVLAGPGVRIQHRVRLASNGYGDHSPLGYELPAG
jgi:hypothetical protein